MLTAYELGLNAGISRIGNFPGNTRFPGNRFPGKSVREFPIFGNNDMFFFRDQLNNTAQFYMLAMSQRAKAQEQAGSVK